MKFLLTKELGRLAKWLRILGFDAEYFDNSNHSALIIKALKDDRVILSRNQHLPKHTGIQIILVHAEEIRHQISEAVKTLHLEINKDIMFTRCILCNTLLEPILKVNVQDKVPEYVFKTQEDFITCPKCNRIYWRGTHWGNVQRCLEEIEGGS